MFSRVCAELQRAAERQHHQAVRCWLTIAAKGPVCHAQRLSQQTGAFLHMLCYVRHKVAHIQSHTDSLTHTQTHEPGLIRHQTATAGCAGATHRVGLTPLWGSAGTCGLPPVPACLPACQHQPEAGVCVSRTGYERAAHGVVVMSPIASGPHGGR